MPDCRTVDASSVCLFHWRPVLEGSVPSDDVRQDETWTIGRLLTWTTDYLRRRGSESPRLDAEVMLAHVLEWQRVQLYTHYEEVVGEQARAAFRDLVRRRAEGAPVAYLVGRKEFYSLTLEVSPAVLIPRPETEFAVVEFLELARSLDQPGRRRRRYGLGMPGRRLYTSALIASICGHRLFRRRPRRWPARMPRSTEWPIASISDWVTCSGRLPGNLPSTSSSRTRPTSPPTRSRRSNPAYVTTNPTWPWMAAAMGSAIAPAHRASDLPSQTRRSLDSRDRYGPGTARPCPH